MKYTATITKGQLLFDNLLHWLDYAKLNEGKKVVVEVIRQKRSKNENNYYWQVLEWLSEETGYTKSELHELFKGMFLKKHIEIKGKSYTVIRSTSELNTTEFEEYLSKIRQLASIEWGYYVKMPNE
jgi:hypothetical protein